MLTLQSLDASFADYVPIILKIFEVIFPFYNNQQKIPLVYHQIIDLGIFLLFPLI